MMASPSKLPPMHPIIFMSHSSQWPKTVSIVSPDPLLGWQLFTPTCLRITAATVLAELPWQMSSCGSCRKENSLSVKGSIHDSDFQPQHTARSRLIIAVMYESLYVSSWATPDIIKELMRTYLYIIKQYRYNISNTPKILLASIWESLETGFKNTKYLSILSSISMIIFSEMAVWHKICFPFLTHQPAW